jgi:hypothetical protein
VRHTNRKASQFRVHDVSFSLLTLAVFSGNALQFSRYKIQGLLPIRSRLAERAPFKRALSLVKKVGGASERSIAGARDLYDRYSPAFPPDAKTNSSPPRGQSIGRVPSISRASA